MKALRTRLIVAVAAVAMASLPTGCKSSVERAREDARDSAAAFQRSLSALPGKIDSTMNKLAELTAPNNANRAQSFREYSDQLNYLRDAGEDLSAQADAANADAHEFFREYVSSSMSGKDPAARQAAMDSLATRKDAVNSALSYLEQGRKRSQDLVGSFRDIQDQLRNNLSDDAVARVRQRSGEIITPATDVKNYIARLEEQIRATLNIK